MVACADFRLIACVLLAVLAEYLSLQVYRSHEGNATTIHVQFLNKILTVRHPQAVQEIISKLSPFPDEISGLDTERNWTSPSPAELLYLQPDYYTRGLFTRIQVLEWLSSSPSMLLNLSFIGMYFNPSVVYWKDHLFLTSRKVNDSKIRRHFSGTLAPCT